MRANRAPDVVLLHNPRCSKSRAAKAWLEERGVPFETRLYLEDALTIEELRALRRKLGRPASEWVRAGEDEYAAAGLSSSSSEDDFLRAIAAHPVLLERPILIRGSKARVGRPTEALMELW